jgi:cytochrome c oxidase subunit IV
MDSDKNHIVPYRTFLIVLAILIVFTIISVVVTQIHLGALTVFTALFLATVKSTFVLRVFMHLKFENRIFTFMVVGVALLIGLVIAGTLFDYIFR